jgi:hypothetical protein
LAAWIRVRIHPAILSQPEAQGKPQMGFKSRSGRSSLASRR